MLSRNISSLLSCVVASSHCAALARSDAPATVAKARNEYGMEQGSELTNKYLDQCKIKTKIKTWLYIKLEFWQPVQH